jgi:hypothetical protein
MKDELSYIDNITGDKLRTFITKPQTDWKTFNLKISGSYKNKQRPLKYRQLLHNKNSCYHRSCYIINNYSRYNLNIE